MTDKIGKDLSSAFPGFLFVFRGKNLYIGEGRFLSGFALRPPMFKIKKYVHGKVLARFLYYNR
ncbi:hypothetical protein D5282_22650 [bacterium 1xD8-48]|nr:hypothetical protein [bacterium 1xD8-48]